MGVTVCLPLFGDPGRELDPRPTGKELRRLGDELRDRLLASADLLDQLHGEGWTSHLGTFDLLLGHPRVDTREQAETRLRALGIDPERFLIVEDFDEEDLDERDPVRRSST